ncbi:vankyrin-b1 [Ichnoviriform fugitivi]|uniref:Vankyrin-b1 n=1 Tax=Ichnoviriform fugitivi TaxID=265522 RepID=Q5BMB1_9VIRU|nr:vankyrin-b1 [Ichnoviriform fugitivi]AAX24120.1 vankyrin-b1 [Ichnoviriform fugitivi]
MTTSEYEYLYGRDNEAGETIFHELAKLGALKVLYRIRERTPGPFVDLLSITNYEGELCTHVAAKYYNGFLAIDLIEVLVSLGADLNGRNSCAGETVLHRTVYDGDYELAEWLCRQPQINLDEENYGGLTAYQIAYKRNDEQLKEIFRKAGANCEEPKETSSEDSDEE